MPRLAKVWQDEVMADAAFEIVKN